MFDSFSFKVLTIVSYFESPTQLVYVIYTEPFLVNKNTVWKQEKSLLFPFFPPLLPFFLFRYYYVKALGQLATVQFG